MPAPRQIVANLPYNIATPLLIGWLRQACAFERLTLMFQQEVAERICAAPGRRSYGRLSVLAQWTCRTDLLLRIPPAAFVPPPKVFSAVVGLMPHAAQPDAGAVRDDGAADRGRVRSATQDAARRLESGLAARRCCRDAGICRIGRAETLNVAEFDRLARLISLRGGALAASE